MAWLLVKDYQSEMGEVFVSISTRTDGGLLLQQFVDVLLESTRVLNWRWNEHTQEYSTQTLQDLTFTNREMYMKYRVFRTDEFTSLQYEPVTCKHFDDLHGILNSATNEPFGLKQIGNTRFNCVLWQECTREEWIDWTDAIVKRFEANGYTVTVRSSELYLASYDTRTGNATLDDPIVYRTRHPHGVLTLELAW